jgi:ankyrin repeat protein
MVDSFNQSLDRLKESFLWAAAQGGNTEDCESLLEIGADVNWKHTDGDTPLLAACRRGHTGNVLNYFRVKTVTRVMSPCS